MYKNSHNKTRKDRPVFRVDTRDQPNLKWFGQVNMLKDVVHRPTIKKGNDWVEERKGCLEDEQPRG